MNSTWITPGSLQGATLLGVADGVGGWRRHGVDPSVLSSGIVREMAGAFRAREKEGIAQLPDGRTMLRESFRKLCLVGSKYAGGTTICFGIFDPRSGILRVVNLGDSGAIVVRNGRVVYETKPDVQGMVPKQLTIFPHWMNELHPIVAERAQPGEQTKCDQTDWQLEAGDVVIFGSDGFFDNVHLQQACHIVELTKQRSDPEQGLSVLPQQLGENILMRAYYNSLNPHFPSPFAVRCHQEGLLSDYWGGKPDDISLVVSVVGETFLTNPTRAASSAN